MDPVVVITIVAASLSAGFAVGVIFHKYVVSEASAIKQHVTDEVAEVRADLSGLLKRTADRL